VTFLLTRNKESSFLKLLQGFLMAVVSVFAIGCFIWSLALRFGIAAHCETPGDPLWNMFMVAVVFACLSGICFSVAFVCVLCACCAFAGISELQQPKLVS